jgi:phospholipase C
MISRLLVKAHAMSNLTKKKTSCSVRWFASVPSSTQPNRLFVHSATSAGATSNIPALLVKGYPQRTIFENLDDAGISWGIYYQNIPATLFYSNLRKLKHITKFHPYGMSFKKHAKQGKLPGYAVLEQRYMDIKISPANDDHPSHDVYQGQMFVKEVLINFLYIYILKSFVRIHIIHTHMITSMQRLL